MPEYPKVFICAPQNEVKAYCFQAWLQNIIDFTYPNYELFLADNSEKNNFGQKMVKCGVYVERIKPKGRSIDQILALSHNACRERFLKSDAEYMLHLETDVFPPHNIIEMLLSCKRNVVAAMYHINEGAKSHLMIQLPDKGESDHFKSIAFLGEGLVSWMDGGIHNVYHAGLGCVLIHRDVFKKIKFRYVTDDAGKVKDARPDTFFAHDLFANNINFYVDTSIICKHRNQAWGKFGVDFK